MKCPLHTSRQVDYWGEAGRVEKIIFKECIQDKCAWYHSKYGQCMITMLVVALNRIQADIHCMREKLRGSNFESNIKG